MDTSENGSLYPNLDAATFKRGHAENGHKLSLGWFIDEWALIHYDIPTNSPIKCYWADLEEWVVRDYLEDEITDEPNKKDEAFHRNFACVEYDSDEHTIRVDYIDD